MRLPSNLLFSALLLAATLSAATPSRARASSVLDQSWDPSGPPAVGGGVGYGSLRLAQAQTLTVGVTGHLVQVDVYLLVDQGSGPNTRLPTRVDLNIYRVTGGDYFDGTGVLIGGVEFVDDQFGGPVWTSSTFGENAIPVTAGDRLAISMSTPDNFGELVWWGDAGEGYAGGQSSAISATYVPVEWQRQGYDLRFRTFVAPEPSTVGLIAAFIIVVLVLRLAPRSSVTQPEPLWRVTQRPHTKAGSRSEKQFAG